MELTDYQKGIQRMWWYVRHALPAVSKQRTYSHVQVPKLLREPYIYTGFRPINKPWRYYLASLFQVRFAGFPSLKRFRVFHWRHLIGFSKFFSDFIEMWHAKNHLNQLNYMMSFCMDINEKQKIPNSFLGEGDIDSHLWSAIFC